MTKPNLKKTKKHNSDDNTNIPCCAIYRDSKGTLHLKFPACFKGKIPLLKNIKLFTTLVISMLTALALIFASRYTINTHENLSVMLFFSGVAIFTGTFVFCTILRLILCYKECKEKFFGTVTEFQESDITEKTCTSIIHDDDLLSIDHQLEQTNSELEHIPTYATIS